MKLSLLLLTIFHGLNVAAASDSPNFNWDKSSATVTAKFSTGQYIVSGKYKINLTRQTIASLMGLRVETVIRATKTLAQKGKLTIENRVLYL